MGDFSLQTRDLILDLELSALDISQLRIGCGRMGRRIRQLFFQSAVFQMKFCKVVFKAHSNLQRIWEPTHIRNSEYDAMMTQNLPLVECFKAE